MSWTVIPALFFNNMRTKIVMSMIQRFVIIIVLIWKSKFIPWFYRLSWKQDLLWYAHWWHHYRGGMWVLKLQPLNLHNHLLHFNKTLRIVPWIPGVCFWESLYLQSTVIVIKIAKLQGLSMFLYFPCYNSWHFRSSFRTLRKLNLIKVQWP